MGPCYWQDLEAAAALAEYWAKEAERYAGGGYSRPNLLDNWYFVDPINQRQAVAFEGRYGADRWIGTSVKIAKGGFSFSPSGNIVQLLEMGESIRGKTVSLSILFSDNTLSHGVFIYADSPSETVSFEDSRVAIGLLQDLLGIRITTKIRATAVAAKLEFGPTQTLAHQENGVWVLNDPPPNKAIELEKCQRYYYQTWVGAEVPKDGYKGVSAFAGSTGSIAGIQFPQTMATDSPSITLYNPKTGETDAIMHFLDDANVPRVGTFKSTRFGFCISANGLLTAGDMYMFHYAVSCEL